MVEIYRPETAEELRDLVSAAVANEAPLEVLGHGTKRDFGRPVETERLIQADRLAGIELYEPGELVLSAGAGTPLAEIEAALVDNHQAFAFEPPDLGPLFGAPAGQATIGGVVAANLAGPRRIKTGAARDHMLGFTAVTGRGDIVKSGGRVVKNVTGYDLSKLMTGSFGTLAVLTTVTLKVLPAAETERTLLVGDGERRALLAGLRSAVGSAYDVAGAAWLPAEAAAKAGLAEGDVAAIRLEGPEPSVRYRADALRTLLGLAEAGLDEIDDARSRNLWRQIRDVEPLLGNATQVVRASIPPAAADEVWERLSAIEALAGYADWAGGLLWLGCATPDPAVVSQVRDLIAAGGGHATLIKAPEEVRQQVEVFQPQPAPLARLTARVKESFDPSRVLNPGRMYPGV
jgi:glycolate oxidase FAD binding subunit